MRAARDEGAVQGEHRVRSRESAASAHIFTLLDECRLDDTLRDEFTKCLPFLRVGGGATCWSTSRNKSER